MNKYEKESSGAEKKPRETVIILAKCGKGHKTYGMRTEKVAHNHWRATWAFPIKEASAKREGYDQAMVSGGVEFPAEYPGCPYCGGREIAVCFCGHVGCLILKNGLYTCEWCEYTSELGYHGDVHIKAGGDR